MQPGKENEKYKARYIGEGQEDKKGANYSNFQDSQTYYYNNTRISMSNT